jgi:hypothetical protein
MNEREKKEKKFNFWYKNHKKMYKIFTPISIILCLCSIASFIVWICVLCDEVNVIFSYICIPLFIITFIIQCFSWPLVSKALYYDGNLLPNDYNEEYDYTSNEMRFFIYYDEFNDLDIYRLKESYPILYKEINKKINSKLNEIYKMATYNDATIQVYITSIRPHIANLYDILKEPIDIVNNRDELKGVKDVYAKQILDNIDDMSIYLNNLINVIEKQYQYEVDVQNNKDNLTIETAKKEVEDKFAYIREFNKLMNSSNLKMSCTTSN